MAAILSAIFGNYSFWKFNLSHAFSMKSIISISVWIMLKKKPHEF